MPTAAAADATSEPVADKVEDAAAALLGGQLAEQMPDVDLSTINNHQQAAEPEKTAGKQQEPPRETAKPAAVTASKAALVDSQGRTFNPLLHETDANGQPVLRKGTSIIKCRRVPLKEAKHESRVQIQTPEPQPQPTESQPQPQPEPKQVDPEKMAAMQQAGAATIAGMQIQLMRLALGEQTANSVEEREMLVEAWRETFAHYGMGNVHPLIGLALVTGGVVMKSIQQPEGRSRWQRFTQWARLKIGGVIFRLTGRKPHHEPEQKAA